MPDCLVRIMRPRLHLGRVVPDSVNRIPGQKDSAELGEIEPPVRCPFHRAVIEVEKIGRASCRERV